MTPEEQFKADHLTLQDATDKLIKITSDMRSAIALGNTNYIEGAKHRARFLLWTQDTLLGVRVTLNEVEVVNERS